MKTKEEINEAETNIINKHKEPIALRAVPLKIQTKLTDP